MKRPGRRRKRRYPGLTAARCGLVTDYRRIADDIPGERWLPVPGWEGYYEVSDKGRVYSHHCHRVLRGSKSDALPYRMITLCRVENGEQIRDWRWTHDLVLTTFTGPRPPGAEARHGAAGQGDDSLANLTWGTKSENQLDRIRDYGSIRSGIGVARSRLSETQVRGMRALYADGIRIAELARRFSVSYNAAYQICHELSWKHILYTPSTSCIKLTDTHVRAIRSRRAAGEKLASIAEDFSVSISTICRVANGDVWKHVK